MIIRYDFLFLLFSLVFSDEHIPRQSENTIKDVPGNDLKQPNLEVFVEPGSNEIPEVALKKVPFIEEPHKESSIKSVPVAQDGVQTPNAGVEIFRDSSYITFTTLIQTRSIDCFFYKARKSFDVDFQVLKGGDFDIAVTVYDVNNKMVSFHKPAGDGTIKVVVEPGMVDTDYSVCLDNKQCSWHQKKVFIMIDVEGPNGVNHPDLQVGEYAQIQNHISKLDLMNTAISNVHDSLKKIEQHQDRRRLVEAIDRSIMESNYEYVTFWAIIQIVMMVAVAGIQLVMIRSLFDVGLGAKVWKKLNSWTGGRF